MFILLIMTLLGGCLYEPDDGDGCRGSVYEPVGECRWSNCRADGAGGGVACIDDESTLSIALVPGAEQVSRFMERGGRHHHALSFTGRWYVQPCRYSRRPEPSGYLIPRRPDGVRPIEEQPSCKPSMRNSDRGLTIMVVLFSTGLHACGCSPRAAVETS